MLCASSTKLIRSHFHFGASAREGHYGSTSSVILNMTVATHALLTFESALMTAEQPSHRTHRYSSLSLGTDAIPAPVPHPIPRSHASHARRLAAQPSKFPYWLNEFDRGGRSIDWEAVYKNVVKKDKLLGTMSHLTSSGHVVIGVSIHVGRDGDVREFAQNVDSFIRKPFEGGWRS